MFRVRLGFGMASRAGEHRVVRGIGMAIATGSRRVVIHREPAVRERGACPGGRVMAGVASGSESCRGMIWNCYTLV